MEKHHSKLNKFFHSSLAGGVILIACTAIALTLSHIPATAQWFHSIWETRIVVGVGDWAIDHTFKEWINDALMAVFFFVVGLEIKREIVAGELSTLKQATLPIAAAIGGMLIPAGIYMMFNYDNATTFNGWGIPMATDIAFALGILSVFSKKVPLSLKIFLTALAVVDDLGAIIVIAIFYSSTINLIMISLAATLLLVLFTLNKSGVLEMKWYIIPSIIIWIAFLHSGIHATIAGVLIAIMIPVKSKYPQIHFIEKSKELTDKFIKCNQNGLVILKNEKQHQLLQSLRVLTRNTIPPVMRLEHALHPAVTFFIMPIFALANAGVVVSIADLPQLWSEQGLGIQLGLVLGKPIGIVLSSFLVIKLGIAAMPKGATWKSLIGVGFLGGVGFTMSIFIDMLAFPAGSPEINYGKMAILLGSLFAAIIGAVILSSGKDIDNKYHW